MNFKLKQELKIKTYSRSQRIDIQQLSQLQIHKSGFTEELIDTE